MKGPLTRFAYVIVFVMAVGYAFIAFPQGLHAWREKQRLIRDMETRNAALAKEVERRKDHIVRLTNNPTEQELEIRRRLKLAKPGEKIYILGEPEAAPPAGNK